jgi:2-aminoethylphosphonate-pyruvate transaminase
MSTEAEAGASALRIPDRFPLLFTCGPLQTATSVKQAMIVDYSSRDDAFVACVAEVRAAMLRVAGVAEPQWACVPMQGPGTMGLEASALTVTQRGGRYLVVNTGKYAERQADMAKHLGFAVATFDVPETQPISVAAFEAFLAANAATPFDTVGFVHHETSTGMINPVAEMFRAVRSHMPQCAVLMDSISSFGGVAVNVDLACDVAVLSSNKVFHSVPGFSCCLVRRSLLAKSKGRSASFTLDLRRQCDGLDRSGQFPFTPPVHAMLAFRQAVREFDATGGVAGRARRYARNARVLRDGMRQLGFRTLLDDGGAAGAALPAHVGNMLVSFVMPTTHPRWNFKAFYNGLKERGFVIYPGKASSADAFRFACFGDITPDDCARLVAATGAVLREMGADLRGPTAGARAKL